MRVLFMINYLSIEGDPMGVMQLAAIARNAGWETALCVAEEDYAALAAEWRPDLIAVSMMVTDYLPLLHAIRTFRSVDPQVPIVVGGPHPTYSPELIEEPEITAICVGEGDRAFTEVLRRLAAGDDLDGIGNIHTKTTKGELMPLVEDLDSLPFLDRDIVYAKSTALRTFRLRSFYASRGCPYRCTYCFNHAFNDMYRGLGRIVRRRSVGNLIDEIKEVVAKYPTDYIRFSDDMFAHRVDAWLEEFAARYPAEVGIPFYCLVRANSVTEQMVRLLREAGCRSACMSIEAGNDRIREQVIKRSMTRDQIESAFDTFNRHGIRLYTNSIVGLPTSTLETDLETLDLTIRCRPAYGGFTIALPFPGTEMYEYCRRTGALPDDLSVQDLLSFGEESVLTCFTAKEKRIQRNLVLLAPIVVALPFLRSLFVRFLIHLRPNPLYVLLHYAVRNYLFKKHIVPIKLGFRDIVTLGYSQVRSEVRTWLARWNSRSLRIEPQSTKSRKLWS